MEYAVHTGRGNLVLGHGHGMLFVSLPVSLKLKLKPVCSPTP